MSLGAKLRKIRLQSGLSLQQLADKVEVSKAHIYELEIGKVKNPSVEVLKKISKNFSVPITFFIEDDNKMEFQVMFRDLEKDMSSLSEGDRETIASMVKVLKAKNDTKDGN